MEFWKLPAPPGQFGEVRTPDDMRETWIWGTGFRAANGKTFSGAQIRYFVDMAAAEIERRLNIAIKKGYGATRKKGICARAKTTMSKRDTTSSNSARYRNTGL
jgi:hypothetical protein